MNNLNTEIKVIYVQSKITKKGTKYKLVHCVVLIEGIEFMRKFYVYER